MNTLKIKENVDFIGRRREIEKLMEIENNQRATVIFVLGRRRIGKTELIEQYFRKKRVLKFEGIQPDHLPTGEHNKSYQIKMILKQLAKYTGNDVILKLSYDNWYDVFNLIANYVNKGEWILYFEEVQWLANYQSNFFAELKPVWDNILRHNQGLILVLCGSSPSFIINQILSDKAFYNRSHEEIHLREFSLVEIREFLGIKHSIYETMLANLAVGGIPEYLKYLKREPSIFLGLCNHSFTPNSFFSMEKEKIFVSSLSNNKNFENIVKYLSVRKHATREEIARAIKTKSGGFLTELLKELEVCGFIERYTPAQLTRDSLVGRYCISDSYLQYYYKFIYPISKDIQNGDFNDNPTKALSMDQLNKWLGFAFERFCRKNHRLIAGVLGFGAVKYKSGAFFTRSILKEKEGFQIDLVYIRDDNVITICEVKYRETKIGSNIIPEFEKKIELFKKEFPRADKTTLSRVLITTYGAEKSLLSRAYFDRIINLEELFKNTQIAF